jgi:hypothetical protein
MMALTHQTVSHPWGEVPKDGAKNSSSSCLPRLLPTAAVGEEPWLCRHRELSQDTLVYFSLSSAYQSQTCGREVSSSTLPVFGQYFLSAVGLVDGGFPIWGVNKVRSETFA